MQDKAQLQKDYHHFHFIVLQITQKALEQIASQQTVEFDQIPKNGYQLYFTEQVMASFKQNSGQNEFQQLSHYLTTDLCYYPLQGRLLLNRHAKDADINQLRWQLAERFKKGDIREICYGDWLIVYSHYQSNLYLLTILSLTQSYANVVKLWTGEGEFITL